MNLGVQDIQISDSFLIECNDLISQLHSINTQEYGRTRNYLNGAVTRLSPFITHGILSTKEITKFLLKRESNDLSVDNAYRRIEPFVFQMAWRDYFHRAWEFHQERIFSSLNHNQTSVLSKKIPTAILNAETGIEVLDEQLQCLYQTGYIHNHSRMWIAAFVTNITGTDWRNAAAWFHYHLLDGDLASNTLSWQWVAGTLNKNKKHYIANQDNINKYSGSKQSHTILDRSYDEINAMVPLEIRADTSVDYSLRDDWQPTGNLIPDFVTVTPLDTLKIQDKQTVYLRNFYQLDRAWNTNKGQHILLIEPSMLDKHPLSDQRWRFIEHWALKIQSLQIVIASFDDFQQAITSHSSSVKLVYREHPLSAHWQGQSEKRAWLFDGLEGEYPSFFKFWNKAQKQVKRLGVADTFGLNTLDNTTFTW